jgi:tetratricopeptide (TPR) repeat protein
LSKQDSRRKRKLQKVKQQANLTGEALARDGMQAFKRVDYDGAIYHWTKTLQKKDRPPDVPFALAEAHFRRALSKPVTDLKDLNEAIKLKPNDNCYNYHLALAYHNQGELKKAESIYRSLLSGSPPYERVALPLAQLLIEQKVSVVKDPVAKYLTLQDKAQLSVAEALINQKPASTLARLIDVPSIDPIWRGLLAFALNKPEIAQQNLQNVSDEYHPIHQAVAKYYMGLMAIDNNQLKTTLEYWLSAKSKGYDMLHLRKNLSVLYYHRAVQEYKAGRVPQANEFLEKVSSQYFKTKEFNQFKQQMNWQTGCEVARSGNWQKARQCWEKILQDGESNRRLTFNLALAHQKTDNYIEAAERWREVLRRRPRNADHEDALTDVQVARIWAIVAENYSRVGDDEEAIKTYKNAVKWSPENMELRLKLVELYQTEGRWQAAFNELERILEKEPKNVQALTMMAENYSEEWLFSDNGKNAWLRVLEIEPQNPVARQQLAHLYEKRGANIARWGSLKSAIEIYEEGLKHTPDSPRLLFMIGATYADLKNIDMARHYFNRTLDVKPDDLNTLYMLCQIWLSIGSEPDIEEIFAKIKSLPETTPSGFYIDLAEYCFDKKKVSRAKELASIIEEKYATDSAVLVSLAQLYHGSFDDDAKAVSILKALLEEKPDYAKAHVLLGTIYYEIGQTNIGKRHWQKATLLARKANDQALLYEIKVIKDELVHGKIRSPLSMLRNIPPELLKQMLEGAPDHIREAILDNMDEFMDFIDEDASYV